MRGEVRATRSRRDFLTALGRAAAFAGLGALASRLVVRGIRSGERCANRGVCPGCPASRACPLPQAELARRAGRT